MEPMQLVKVELPLQRKFIQGTLIEETGDRIMMVVDSDATLACPKAWIVEPTGYYCRADSPSTFAKPSSKDRKKSGLTADLGPVTFRPGS